MSLDVAGQCGPPAVREAERHTIETALRFGITPRAEIPDPAETETYG